LIGTESAVATDLAHDCAQPTLVYIRGMSRSVFFRFDQQKSLRRIFIFCQWKKQGGVMSGDRESSSSSGKSQRPHTTEDGQWVQLDLVAAATPADSACEISIPVETPSTPDPDRWRLDPKTAARNWLQGRRSRAYREHSLDQYVAMVGAAATWWTEQGGGATLLTATGEDVLAFLQSRGRGNAPNLSATTTRRYLGLLGDVFQHLVDSGWRADNPVPGLLRLPHLGFPMRAAPIYLKEDLVDAFIAWVRAQPLVTWRDQRDRALRLIFLATGITLDEARKLQPRDVYLGLDTPGLQVSAHHRVKARRVPIAPWAVADLAAWINERTTHAASIGVTPTTGPIFPANSTLPLTHKPRMAPALCSTEIYEIVRPGMEHVLGEGAERMGAQTLRNTFAVRQLKAGASDDTVMRWLGLETSFTLSALRRQIELHSGESVV
jgi:site-specific recombinase XerD